MPRNSTGNYTLPLPPVVSGELIEANWANTSLDDIGQALTESLDRYGRGGMVGAFLFFDGTESNPGAAWANAPGTGFFRDSTHLGFSWSGAEILGYNANGLTGNLGTVALTGAMTVRPDGVINFRNIADTGNSWQLGAGNFVGSDILGLYNPATLAWALQVDPTTNDITLRGVLAMFGKPIRFDYTGVPNGSPLMAVSGVGNENIWGTYDVRNGGQGFLLNELDVSMRVGGVNLALTNDGFVRLTGGVGYEAQSPLTATAFSWIDTGTGDDRVSISALASQYPGITWKWPGVAFMGIYQASSGALWWSTGQDINAVQMTIGLTGECRAKAFTATPNPGQ